MTYSLSSMSRGDKGQCPAIHCWEPASSPEGVLVVAHGMGEHALRYARFAEAANDEGFVVYAIDHRGHGGTVRSEEQLGDFGPDGWRGVVDDLSALVDRVGEAHAALDVVLLGHSMGSFVVQHYLTESSDRIAAAALSGTTAVDLITASPPDPGVDTFTAMNAAFAPNRTAFDWLSRDPDEVDRYVEDPLCGFMVEGASVASMGEAAQVFSRAEAIAGVRPDLPIYLFAGDRDPVGANGQGVELVGSRYREAGVEDVVVRLYPEARHELLNETNREEVTSDFLAWARRFLRS
ncbi:MAG: lysophospholipase [bacterium]|nr:lysophospholipase [bacterium]